LKHIDFDVKAGKASSHEAAEFHYRMFPPDRSSSPLDGGIESVILYGSVTLGEFQPGWSDVDVCTIVKEPVAESQTSKIGRVHDEMRRRFVDERMGGWRSGQVMEGPYIRPRLASDAEAADFCYKAGGTTRKRECCNPITPFDRYMLAHHRVCWW